jgi:Mg2+-importing ATPase
LTTPQLLPAIVSVSLSTGSRQLARRRVLVKRLVTIEDLGNIEVLFTDKTGTLTEGAITFDQALDPAGQPARWPLLLGLVCNEATITAQGPVGGNALDQALWSAPAAQPLAADATGGPRAYQRLGLVPFDHDRQLASVAVRTGSGATLLVAKGAPEAVLARCAEVPGEAQATVARLFADGARVIAVATRDAPELTTPGPADEHGLHLAGFLTFIDRPKADAGRSIAKRRFYAVQAHPRRPRPTQQQRHQRRLQRRLQRRAVRFIHYLTPQPCGRRPSPSPDRPATDRRQPAHDQRSTLGNPD